MFKTINNIIVDFSKSRDTVLPVWISCRSKYIIMEDKNLTLKDKLKGESEETWEQIYNKKQIEEIWKQSEWLLGTLENADLDFKNGSTFNDILDLQGKFKQCYRCNFGKNNRRDFFIVNNNEIVLYEKSENYYSFYRFIDVSPIKKQAEKEKWKRINKYLKELTFPDGINRELIMKLIRGEVALDVRGTKEGSKMMQCAQEILEHTFYEVGAFVFTHSSMFNETYEEAYSHEVGWILEHSLERSTTIWIKNKSWCLCGTGRYIEEYKNKNGYPKELITFSQIIGKDLEYIPLSPRYREPLFKTRREKYDFIMRMHANLG